MLAVERRTRRRSRRSSASGCSIECTTTRSQLSGGQQQRAAVARAVAGKPLVLLADEPTGNLDSANGAGVMSLLRELHQGGATILIVTHDPRYLREAQRTVYLFDGRLVPGAPADREVA